MIVFTIHVTNYKDATYNSLWLGLSACAELTIGIIVVSLITLPKLLDAKFSWLRSTVSKLSTFRSAGVSKVGTTSSRSEAKNVSIVTKGQNLSEINLTEVKSQESLHNDEGTIRFGNRRGERHGAVSYAGSAEHERYELQMV